MVINHISDFRLIELATHPAADGEIVVAESATQVPFAIDRIFIMTAPVGAVVDGTRTGSVRSLCYVFMARWMSFVRTER